MKSVCVLGEGNDNQHVETIVDLFSKKHSVTWMVENEGIARELALKKPDIKISHNNIDMENQDAFIICNETSFKDIKNLSKNVELVKWYGRKGAIVVLESIVGVGTTRKLFTSSSDLHVAYSPFRFENGILPIDTPKLLGGLDEESEGIAMELYSTIFNVIVRTGKAEIAEGAALLEKSNNVIQNAFLNEFANFCTRINLDVHHVIDATCTCVGNDKLLIGNKANDMTSARHLIFHDEQWPLLSTATQQLESRPKKIYEKIVEKYCKGANYDELHKKCFLVVGLGETIGATTTRNSPVLEIITSLELEGALVVKFDMFIDEYSTIPHMKHNSGMPRFDGILVFHPYLVSKWEKYKYTTFFCRH